jgi:DNA-binding transcriptional LysR family regulator
MTEDLTKLGRQTRPCMQRFDRNLELVLNLGMTLRDPIQRDPELSAISSRVTLSQLRTFVTVVETGTYSEAALELGTAQSTLSHAINELERTLGKKLLERGRHGATPTSFGQAILEHAHDALNALEALEQVAHLERDGFRGAIRIASMRSAATHILPAVMQRFHTKHPNIRFELIEEEAHPNGVEGLIREARADLGMMNLGLLNGQDWITHELFVDEYMLIWPDDGRTTVDRQQRPVLEPGANALANQPAATRADVPRRARFGGPVDGGARNGHHHHAVPRVASVAQRRAGISTSRPARASRRHGGTAQQSRDTSHQSFDAGLT